MTHTDEIKLRSGWFEVRAAGRQRWRRIKLFGPGAAAALLVCALGVQAMRESAMHRRVVERTTHEYAAFAAWQFARRASDYIRLRVGDEVRTRGAQDGFTDMSLTDPGAWHGTAAPPVPLAEMASTLRTRAPLVPPSIGVVTVGRGQRPALIAFAAHRRAAVGSDIEIDGYVMDPAELTQMLQHVVQWAPLLPPRLIADSARHGLLGVQVLDADQHRMASYGRTMPDDVVARDSLGPALGQMQVAVHLSPDAAQYLVAGEESGNQTWRLLAMLSVALVLLLGGIWQLRRWDELVQLRANFVAGVSHELRTPLTQISLFADTMLDDDDWPRDQRRQFVTIIKREAVRLQQLVESVLQFALAGRREATPQAILALAHEVDAAVDAFRPIAAAREITIRLTVTGAPHVRGDRHTLRQLVMNLLDNAVKFGPERSVVHVTVAATNGAALLQVADAGGGIAAADRNRVFEPFVRLATAPGSAGTGIGLAVVQDIARQHGASVEIDDAAGGGALLLVRFPSLPAHSDDA